LTDRNPFPAKPLLLTSLVLVLVAGSVAGVQIEPYEIAAGLSRLGPRHATEPQRREVIDYLLATMGMAGLEDVEELAAGDGSHIRNLTGVLPGHDNTEVLLSAHYDTVTGSPGAADDAAGCAVVLAAVADLGRTPLRHTVRVVLFDGEEQELAGSRAWVEDLETAERERILANLNVDVVGWEGSRGSVLHTFPVARGKKWVLTPAWLVYAVLAATEGGDRPLSAIDPWLSVPGQLVMRSSRSRFIADSDSLLVVGIPSVLLSDASFSSVDPAYHQPGDRAERLDRTRLEEWSRTLAATVRRLDELAGRPADDDVYLVALGRVWHRRALYWVGFVVWALLVWRGVPGGWRGTRPAERRRQGRDYLPGFLFRMLLLVSILVQPVFATVMLLPAGLAGTLRPRTERTRSTCVLVSWLPTILFALALVVAQVGGWVMISEALWLPAALVTATLASFTVWMRTVGASAPATRPDASPERP
jgi:hypothetical protein